LPVASPAAVDAGTIVSASANPLDSAQNVHVANFADGGTIPTQEQLAPQAEDNVNAVIAVAIRPLATSTYAPSVYTNFGSSVAANVKASAGNVLAITCANANASTRYIQIHNTTSAPTGGAVPYLSFAVPANSQVVIGSQSLGGNGVYLSTGITMAFSTTAGTYTAASASDQNTQILYK
jgi:hypothetical protein